jgi:two-component system OmpR family sensor kinase
VEQLRSQAAGLAERADQRRLLRVPGTRDEIAALAATMNELLGRLHASLERERRLVADAAHELRTPLAILRTELELADRPGRSREQLVAAINAASEEALLIARLAEDLLFLARTDEGAPVLRRERQQVGPILEAATGQTRRTGRPVNVEAPAQLLADVDEGHLLQAFCNLLSNADRASPPGAAVTLRASADEVSVDFEVTDEGPGFPPDFLPRAFQRFSRVDSSRARSDGGAGLGLAIVPAISRAHGGQASAANRPEEGAQVRLSLPRWADAPDCRTRTGLRSQDHDVHGEADQATDDGRQPAPQGGEALADGDCRWAQGTGSQADGVADAHRR